MLWWGEVAAYFSTPAGLLDKWPKICTIKISLYSCGCLSAYNTCWGRGLEIMLWPPPLWLFPEPQATGRHQGHLGATLLKYEMRGQWRAGPAHDIPLLALSSSPPPLSPWALDGLAMKVCFMNPPEGPPPLLFLPLIQNLIPDRSVRWKPRPSRLLINATPLSVYGSVYRKSRVGKDGSAQRQTVCLAWDVEFN